MPEGGRRCCIHKARELFLEVALLSSILTIRLANLWGGVPYSFGNLTAVDALPRKCMKNLHIISGGYRLLWSILAPGLRTSSAEGMSQVPRRCGDWAASLLSGSWLAHRESPGGHCEKRNVSFGQVLNIKYGGGQIRPPYLSGWSSASPHVSWLSRGNSPCRSKATQPALLLSGSVHTTSKERTCLSFQKWPLHLHIHLQPGVWGTQE